MTQPDATVGDRVDGLWSESIAVAADTIDVGAIEAAVTGILVAIGEDPAREGLADTPKRVAKAYAEMFAGLSMDPARHFDTTFAVASPDIVVVKRLPVRSFCEHHLLPFVGEAHIAYVPSARVAGLSKFPRVVAELAARPQVQENLTSQIADLIEAKLAAAGVLVLVECVHSCMALRGVKVNDALTSTLAARGTLRSEHDRKMAMDLIRG